MNVNYGLFEIPPQWKGKRNREKVVESSLEEIKSFAAGDSKNYAVG